MASPIYTTNPSAWTGYLNTLQKGPTDLSRLQNGNNDYRDVYGNLAIMGSDTAPPNAPTGSVYPANGYSNTPTPQSGTGAFGLVPGSIGAPDVHGDLAKVLPNLDAATSASMGSILPMLRGELPPDVRAQIENEGAGFGATSGMPGSGVGNNRTLRDLGISSLAAQEQGRNALNSLVGSTSQTQTVNPALQTEISATNASNAAAPNPEAQQRYSLNLFQQYLQAMRGKKPNALATGLGTLGGAGVGGFFGGPAGATAGAGIGGSIGKLIGGLF